MSKVLVIHEIDLHDNEHDVIGVADSVEKAGELIKGCYGDDYRELSHRDIRDSSLEYIKILEVKDSDNDFYKVQIMLQWFGVNEL